MTHKGNFQDTIKEIWNHKNLALFANFHSEDEIEQSLKETDIPKNNPKLIKSNKYSCNRDNFDLYKS